MCLASIVYLLVCPRFELSVPLKSLSQQGVAPVFNWCTQVENL